MICFCTQFPFIKGFSFTRDSPLHGIPLYKDFPLQGLSLYRGVIEKGRKADCNSPWISMFYSGYVFYVILFEHIHNDIDSYLITLFEYIHIYINIIIMIIIMIIIVCYLL